MGREENKMPRLRVKGPRQSLTGVGGGGGGETLGFPCPHKNRLTHELSQYDASVLRGTFLKWDFAKG